MDVKIFRETGSLDISRLEAAMNKWLKSLPPTVEVKHTGTAYCSIEGVPSVLITVWLDSPAPGE